MSQLLDAHYYDGKLHNLYKNIKFPNLCLEQKKRNIEILASMLYNRPTLNDQGRSCLNKVVSDFNDRANYDPSNNVTVEDLLNYIFLYQADSDEQLNDILEMLCIQFNEMISGLCPQGRTHRIAQVLFMLE